MIPPAPTHMTVHPRIEINPAIMLGKPVIRRTRIPVELILRKMSEGSDIGTLLESTYEQIKKEMPDRFPSR